MSDAVVLPIEAQRRLVGAEIRRRIIAHQRAIAQPRPMAAGAAPLNLIALGDSWFAYPVPSPIFPTDVIQELKNLLSIPDDYILSLAHPGDATTTLMGVTRHQQLYDNLVEPKNGAIDGVLLSGGGDDLAGEQFRLWLNDAAAVGADPARAINTTAYADILGVVETSFRDLIATCQEADSTTGRQTLLFVNAYDFALPTGKGVCGLGPWLAPSLISRGWMADLSDTEIARGAGIVKQFLQTFQEVLVKLAANPLNNLTVAPTQGALGPDDWANELHPTGPGFRKIAQKFAETLAARFPGRAVLA